jgi:Lrp/AsnC family transcriptional regulator for asnA, asnC and gidA
VVSAGFSTTVLPAASAGAIFHVLGRPAPFEHARGTREEAQLIDERRDLVGGHERLRLAGRAALRVDEAAGVLLDGIGDAQERAPAIGGSPRAPAGERRDRCRDRGGDIGRARSDGLAVRLTRARVDERSGCAVSCVGPLTVHEVGHMVHDNLPRWLDSSYYSHITGRHRENFVANNGPNNGIRTKTRTESGALLDDVSMAIIRELQHDGRRPYTSIAKTVGLSEAAVRQRVQRLLDAGVMQIVAVTDPLRVGFHRQAMVGIRVDGDVREIAQKLAASTEIDYVVICSGAYDLLVELTARDDEHLLDVCNSQIRSIPGIRSTEMFMYLRLEKQTYSWGN